MKSENILRFIKPHRAAMYLEYYKICFDAQGCPMKRLDERIVFHPILAAYLIFDLVRAYEDNGNKETLEAAQRVAMHSLNQANEFKGALVFYYSEADSLSSVPGSFYSALTQAWYLRSFSRLNRHKPVYSTVLKKLFKSLKIPKSEGGVLIEKPFGWIVEEYPYEPTFYTLNGWLTVLRWIIESADELVQYGVEVQNFLDRNIDAAAALLPLFDAEFCLNSRYQLTGFSRLQVIVDREIDFHVESFSIEIPGEGLFLGELEPQRSRWKNYMERNEGRLRQFNIVMSLISAPQPNLLRLSFSCSAPCNLRLRLAKGGYRPDCTAMSTERWDEISKIKVTTSGKNSIECQLPFDAENMFAYPTNFKKKINDKYYNGYHFIHIVDCAEIFRFSKRKIFRDYAMKFLRYQECWSKLELPPLYALTPHLHYPGSFSEFVEALLGSEGER
jgi:hypothetical protein